MTLRDWSRSAAGAALGSLAGFLFLYSDLWVMAVVVLPLFVVVILLEATGGLLATFWKRWRGDQVQAPRRAPTELPWQRRYLFHVGFRLGALLGLVVVPFAALAIGH